MEVLDPLATEFVNIYQGGFPVTEKPYAEVASRMQVEEEKLLSTIKDMLESRWLTRFGPLYDAKQMGGGLTLAALSVPDSRFDDVTSIVNAYAEVAHNYKREHKLNMWFVVATETEQAVLDVIKDIELQTGLNVFNCPKLQEFYVGLKLHIDKTGNVDSVPMDDVWLTGSLSKSSPAPPDEFERKIIAVTQSGLPLVPEPFTLIAEQINSDTDSVMGSIQKMLSSGVMRRIGAVPNHYKLGLRGNGMTVWDVPDELVSEIGASIGSMNFVSHCYERPRHFPHWPFNLFAMVHGSDKSQVMDKLALMEDELFPHKFPHEVLFSSAILKKSGLRIAA